MSILAPEPLGSEARPSWTAARLGAPPGEKTLHPTPSPAECAPGKTPTPALSLAIPLAPRKSKRRQFKGPISAIKSNNDFWIKSPLQSNVAA